MTIRWSFIMFKKCYVEIWEEDFLYFHIRSFPKAIYVLWFSCICNHHMGFFGLLLMSCFQIDRHNITETLLKVALNTITTPFLPITQWLSRKCKLNWSIWTSVKIPKDICHPLCILAPPPSCGDVISIMMSDWKIHVCKIQGSTKKQGGKNRFSSHKNSGSWWCMVII
jgi:hypothetical protein